MNYYPIWTPRCSACGIFAVGFRLCVFMKICFSVQIEDVMEMKKMAAEQASVHDMPHSLFYYFS